MKLTSALPYAPGIHKNRMLQVVDLPLVTNFQQYTKTKTSLLGSLHDIIIEQTYSLIAILRKQDGCV